MTNLIYCVFFLLFPLVQNQQLDAQKRYQIAIHCIQEVGVERKVVEIAMLGRIPQNNPKYKDFLACSYKKQGYQYENGTINMDNVTKFLQQFYRTSDLVKLKDCNGDYGENHSEIAFDALMCIMDKLHQMNSTST